MPFISSLMPLHRTNHLHRTTTNGCTNSLALPLYTRRKLIVFKDFIDCWKWSFMGFARIWSHHNYNVIYRTVTCWRILCTTLKMNGQKITSNHVNMFEMKIDKILLNVLCSELYNCYYHHHYHHRQYLWTAVSEMTYTVTLNSELFNSLTFHEITPGIPSLTKVSQRKTAVYCW